MASDGTVSGNLTLFNQTKRSYIQDLYFVMKKGKGSKTRSIEVYVAENGKGNTFLYFMG